ncbi:MAG: hypothetical protein JWN96_3138 [Mycobacterium sp.]|nr:hypothetical protein [Mycobacterium sp.]
MSTTHRRAEGSNRTVEQPEQGHWLGEVREGYLRPLTTLLVAFQHRTVVLRRRGAPV